LHIKDDNSLVEQLDLKYLEVEKVIQTENKETVIAALE